MQEVFEKIIERLRIEKNMDRSKTYSEAQCDTIRYSLGMAIDIMKAAAVEYNNGWIPVEDGLPQKPQAETPDDCCPEYIVMIDGADEATTLKYSPDGEWFDENGVVYKIIAWQPLPEPYRSNTCTETDCPYNEGKDCPAAEGCAGYQPKGG